jgi:tetratricopeptide (TPR) repeat protein
MTSTRRLSTFALSLCALLCTAPARPQAAAPAVPPQPSASANPTPDADDSKAIGLIRDATNLEHQRNWPEALKKLDEAKAVNPQEPFLWSSYGYIAVMNSKTDEAIEDVKRELTNHPDEENVYMLLAQIQVQQQHKPQDAIATLQKVIALNPANAAANNTLALLLLGDKQYPAAEKAFRGILAAHPDDMQTQLRLSSTLALEDKKSEALALLKPIAENSQDPALLNDAAFALADDNLDLPLAERTARRSLALLDAQSVPGLPGPKPLLRTEVLVSVWDTFGWTLFCEGKVAEAEPWVRAAWSNSLGAESGYHLGMILEKLGQPVKAMAIYQMASLGDPSNNDAIADNITARQAALRKAGTPDQVSDGKSAFQALHTFKVPGLNTLNGQALIEIEFSTQGASNATIVRDDPNHDSLTPVETALDRIDYKASLPPGSHVTLVRRGILTCHAKTPCQFALFTTRAAFQQAN